MQWDAPSIIYVNDFTSLSKSSNDYRAGSMNGTFSFPSSSSTYAPITSTYIVNESLGTLYVTDQLSINFDEWTYDYDTRKYDIIAIDGDNYTGEYSDDKITVHNVTDNLFYYFYYGTVGQDVVPIVDPNNPIPGDGTAPLNWLLKLLSDLFGGILSFVVSILSGLWNIITSFLGNAAEAITGFFSALTPAGGMFGFFNGEPSTDTASTATFFLFMTALYGIIPVQIQLLILAVVALFVFIGVLKMVVR